MFIHLDHEKLYEIRVSVICKKSLLKIRHQRRGWTCQSLKNPLTMKTHFPQSNFVVKY